MRVGGLERLLGLLVPAHLGQRLHERGGRPEHAQAAGVGVARARGRRVGHGVLERAGPEARLRPEHQQRADAVVGLRPAGLVDRLGEDPLGVLEPVGDRHVVHGEPDDDDQDRVALERLHRPLREVGGVRGRLAGHRHLHGGDRELQGAVELAVLDALAHPGGALVHRAPRVDGEARHAQHVALDVQGQGRVRVRAGGERALLDLDRLHRVLHADHRPERARRVEPRHRVLGGLDAAAQVLDRRLALERERLRQPELEQRGGAALGPRRLLEGAAQVGDRRVGRPARDRLARRVAEPVAHPFAAARLGGEQMRGDPLGGGVLAREQARRACVAGRPHGRRELLVDRAADDRVSEAQRARVGQDAAGAQGVGGLGGLPVVEVRERGGVADERAVARDRGRARELLGRGREARQARADRGDHALGRDAEHVAGSGLAEGARELAQEERVAAGQLMARAAQRRRGVRDGGAHQLGRRVLAERLRAQQRGRALRQQLGDRGAAGLAERPRGEHDQDRDPAEPVAQIGHEPQRRCIGPVRVVDEQRERRPAGEVGGQPVEAVQGGERPLRPERQVGGLGQLDVEQRRGAARRAFEEVVVRDDGLEQLAHDAEAEGALELGPARRQRRQPGARRLGARRGEQLGLADPGRALEDHRAALTGGDRLRGGADVAELLAPLEKAHRPILWLRGGEREGERLAVGPGAQRVASGDRLLEADRHRVVGHRPAVGEQGVGLAAPPTAAYAPSFARACSACGRANEPLTSLPVLAALGSATVSVASAAVLTTVAPIVAR